MDPLEAREARIIRLNQLSESISKDPNALAFIGVGSSGAEQHRMDQYSDLDFFVVVRPSFKDRYLSDLGWLGSVCGIAYAFRNTPDGYKFFFNDGIFCEFAVFEPAELPMIQAPGAKTLWASPSAPKLNFAPPLQHRAGMHSVEWLVGEALTNMYVGLCRDHRGEKLSAMRFIQIHAVDRVIELVSSGKIIELDPFASERRFEQHFPDIAGRLSLFMQGYDKNRESALQILAFLKERFDVNPFINDQIVQLASGIRSI